MNKINTLNSMVKSIGFEGKSLLSVNDLSNDQIYGLFELGKALEPWNRSKVDFCSGKILATLFFQPSTRTRMSFETAMHRLGGDILTEANPLVTSSAAKEESLSDMLKVVSKYANAMVLRHFDDAAAKEAAPYADSPLINGGWGHWEHPTQALLDLYTLYRVFGKIEGLKICIASPNLIEARTGHSMAYGLARLGAKVYLASTSQYRTPTEVITNIKSVGNPNIFEQFDFTQGSFNEMVSDMDYIYLPGCSAPKGPEAEAFKIIMDNYFVRFETLDKVAKEQKRNIFITHTLPRRAGEMDLRIDNSPHQLYFDAIAYSVAIRMALLAAILGTD